MSDSEPSEIPWELRFIGSIDESKKILDWGQTNCPHWWKKCIDNLEGDKFSAFDFAVYLAKICRMFESKMSLKSRTFAADSEEDSDFVRMVQHIVDDGRYIIGVYDEDKNIVDERGERHVQFAYTIGNHYDDIETPELLCFYPSSATQGFLLNRVSDSLSIGSIKPLEIGETVLIEGVLGSAKQHPIRLRLFDEKERQESYEKWTCQLDPNTDIILLEVPDTNGYFADEDCYSGHLNRIAPKSLSNSVITRSIKNFSGKPEYPVDLYAMFECMTFHNSFISASDNQGVEKDFESIYVTCATKRVICECQYEFDPDLISDVQASKIDQIVDSIRFMCSTKNLRQVMTERLSDVEIEGDSEDFNSWCVKCPYQLDEYSVVCPNEVKYNSFRELIDDVDWFFASLIVRLAYEDSLDQVKLRDIKESLIFSP